MIQMGGRLYVKSYVNKFLYKKQLHAHNYLQIAQKTQLVYKACVKCYTVTKN